MRFDACLGAQGRATLPRIAPSGRKEHALAKGKSHSNREVKKPKQVKKADPAKAGELFAKGIQIGAGDKKK